MKFSHTYLLFQATNKIVLLLYLITKDILLLYIKIAVKIIEQIKRKLIECMSIVTEKLDKKGYNTIFITDISLFHLKFEINFKRFQRSIDFF